MPRRLRVFQAQFGFWDCVVAASSQAAALRAWGTRQNLFADGEAREITDERAVAAALAHPDTPLRRAVGSSDPFCLEPGLPHLPDTVSRRASGVSAKPRPARPPLPPPDRGPLDAAEAALRRLDDARAQEEAGFERRRADLANEETRARRLYASARSQAETEVRRCRSAFAKAGKR